MASAIKPCSLVVVVIVGLIALSHYTLAAPVEETSGRTDLNSAPSERLFLGSGWNYNTNTRPYYSGGYYPNQRPIYSNGYYPGSTNGFYPNTNGGWGNTNGYYPGQTGSGWGNTNNGYYPSTTGNGGYGGFGGNGGLTTYYGYGRDDYYGDRNMGFGYQQGTNSNGFSGEGDRNLNYNSYPISGSSLAAPTHSTGGLNGYVY